MWCSYVSEIASPVISWLEWLLLPHINIVILFLVVEMGISESECIIWRYELIFDVCVHLIWIVGGYIWICTLHLKIWIHILCLCELHLVHFIWYWGVYLISAFTSSEKLTVTTHIMNSWTLNNLCRLIYVVVIVVTISYSCCYFWSFLPVTVHA